MHRKPLQKKFWTIVPPWVFLGAVAVLFPIFAFLTFENINREKESSSRLLLEKGAALIRAFEAGTRTGMMGMHWDGFQLQRLLTETAQQPDIAYLLVTDTQGNVLAHDDPSRIGGKHGEEIDLKGLFESDTVQWRVVDTEANQRVFEVVSRFAPSGPMMGRRHGRMMFERLFDSLMEKRPEGRLPGLVIFVGLDMESVEEAVKADTRHTVIMGVILLFIGFAGVILLFLAQNYRAAQTSLSRIKAFSDTVVENMPIGLLATDAAGKIASLNPVGASLLGLRTAESTGRNIREILPRELADLMRESTFEIPVEKEIDCTLKTGDSIPLEAIVSGMQEYDGSKLGYLVLFKDLTEVRALKKEIARSQRLAAVGRLAAGVAHEIRNPLSSIKGFAVYFKERYRENPEDQQISGIMIQEVDRLNKVVGQLLDFARPVTIKKKGVILESFIADSIKLVERQAKEKGIDITVQVPADTQAVMDPERISQVLLNLYLNALEAMDPGGRILVAAVKKNESREVEIRIRDTGVGIYPEDLSHIFDPYFTTKPTGTGLGLAIVHNILEAHGTPIQFDSRPGKGTTVTLVFEAADRKR
ncbi:MAG: PAS domain S-box protein [Deltaproteobacteria bacterium]|nr:PAS domain S-box protein [Deltaproteobacteria bacterium]MBW1955203.1 PAS domain S-box protein [Deltaproteobacteria bacterium]